MNANHLKTKRGSNTIISGPSGSGKTLLMRRICENYKLLLDNVGSKLNVLWYYGQWQPLYNVPIKNKNVLINYFDGLPTESQINEFKPDVIVIDDLMHEI